MTNTEQTIAFALERCNYQPASFEKRFARDMAAQARTNPSKELTERQRIWLYKQAWRYRRQLPLAVQNLIPENGELKQSNDNSSKMADAPQSDA